MYLIYNIEATSLSAIEVMMKSYYNNIIAPMDDMWEEGYIAECSFYYIKSGKLLGFFALNSDHVLLLFHLEEQLFSNDIFDYIIRENKIKRAYASTYDPLFYEQCNRLMINKTVNTLLYQEDKKLSFKAPFDNILVKYAEINDLIRTATYFREKVDIQGNWIEAYLEKLIKEECFILFIYKDIIIGSSGIRPSISSHGVANIGMTVSKDFRRIGLASFIISKTREICNKNGYHTICSTTVDNVGSQKTLTKCGYYHYHTIYTFEMNI